MVILLPMRGIITPKIGSQGDAGITGAKDSTAGDG